MYAASPAGPRPTTVVLVAVPRSPTAVGVPVTFEATLRPADAYGTVTYSDNGRVIAVLHGYRLEAAYTTEGLLAGGHTITVRFAPVGSTAGTTRYAASTASLVYRITGAGAPPPGSGSQAVSPVDVGLPPVRVLGSRRGRLPFTGAPILGELRVAALTLLAGAAAARLGRRRRTSG